MVGSNPTIFQEGLEPLSSQVIDSQLSINSAVPNPAFLTRLFSLLNIFIIFVYSTNNEN